MSPTALRVFKIVPVAVLLLPSVAACGGGSGPDTATVQACRTFRQAANQYAKQSLGVAAYTTRIGKMQGQAMKSHDKQLATDVTHLLGALTHGTLNQAARQVRAVGRDCRTKGL